MAVSAQNALRDVPEFRRPYSFRGPSAGSILVQPQHRTRRAARSLPRNRSLPKESWSARALRSRLIDDACAIFVGACGVFFALAVARMFLNF